MHRRKTAKDRKSEIIAVLLAQAYRIGPDRLTTNDIAREIGITQAAIFRHFPTKTDLWKEAGNEISDRLRAAWDEALAAGPAPEARLRALIGAQLRQIAECPALPLILFSRELNVDNPDLRESFRRLAGEFQGNLAANLTSMHQAGDLRRDLPPEDAAVILISLVQGMAMRRSITGSEFALVEEGLRLLDQQLRLFRAEAV